MASKMILPHGKSRAGAGRVAALDRFANNAAPSPLSGQDLYAACPIQAIDGMMQYRGQEEARGILNLVN